MWNKDSSVSHLNSHSQGHSTGNCAAFVRQAIEAGGITITRPAPRPGLPYPAAADYGPHIQAKSFVPVFTYAGNGGALASVTAIPGQQAGDVVVIQPIPGHPYGHMAMFNGTQWVSDYKQADSFYPARAYQARKPAFVMYRYGAQKEPQKNAETNKNDKIKICYPILKQNGQEFAQQEDILAHLGGEATGTYMLGRNGMWHGGIHITNATTPWCALSGKGASESKDFPVPYKGEQAVRCMADGEVVAYRICRDYLNAPWETGPLDISGSFVLVRHYIQLGEKKESGLHFYTLYMHLAPWSAYKSAKNINWITQDSLSGYSDDPAVDRLIMELSRSTQKTASAGTVKKGTSVSWDDADPSLTSNSGGRSYGQVTLNADSGNLKSGQKVWMLVDNNNIKPAPESGPDWWKHLLPPAKEAMVFDKTVSLSTPFIIKAGDSVGHLGYFQAPKEGGYESRYQVHIECLSMDENLETFLKNPEKIGQASPMWLKCPTGLSLYEKDAKTGAFASGGKTTSGEAILKLSQLKTEKDSSKQEYWYLPFANGYAPVNGKGTEKLSQYDLEKLGFKTTTDESITFDHLDGKTPPKGLVRTLFESLFEASSNDTRASHGAVPHNYQRLLNKIDSGVTPYSPQEYLSAVHNPSYRESQSKIIVKHPSEWYHKKGDAIWQPFLDNLKKDAPEWKAYSEGYIEKMTWMQDVTKEKLGPMVWHMHPVMFLGALNQSAISLEEARVRAFLRMIRVCEGTTGEEGYERLFGGESFIKDYHKTFATHPQIKIKRTNKKTGKTYISSAAGAYQVMGYTWSDPATEFWRGKYKVSDFSPACQDLLCVVILREKVRGDALTMIINNKVKDAIEQSCSYEWASLPPSRHGQPIKSISECLSLYNKFLQQELNGNTDLHIANGFLKGF